MAAASTSMETPTMVRHFLPKLTLSHTSGLKYFLRTKSLLFQGSNMAFLSRTSTLRNEGKWSPGFLWLPMDNSELDQEFARHQHAMKRIPTRAARKSRSTVPTQHTALHGHASGGSFHNQRSVPTTRSTHTSGNIFQTLVSLLADARRGRERSSEMSAPEPHLFADAPFCPDCFTRRAILSRKQHGVRVRPRPVRVCTRERRCSPTEVHSGVAINSANRTKLRNIPKETVEMCPREGQRQQPHLYREVPLHPRNGTQFTNRSPQTADISSPHRRASACSCKRQQPLSHLYSEVSFNPDIRAQFTDIPQETTHTFLPEGRQSGCPCKCRQPLSHLYTCSEVSLDPENRTQFINIPQETAQMFLPERRASMCSCKGRQPLAPYYSEVSLNQFTNMPQETAPTFAPERRQSGCSCKGRAPLSNLHSEHSLNPNSRAQFFTNVPQETVQMFSPEKRASGCSCKGRLPLSYLYREVPINSQNECVFSNRSPERAHVCLPARRRPTRVCSCQGQIPQSHLYSECASNLHRGTQFTDIPEETANTFPSARRTCDCSCKGRHPRHPSAQTNPKKRNHFTNIPPKGTDMLPPGTNGRMRARKRKHHSPPHILRDAVSNVDTNITCTSETLEACDTFSTSRHSLRCTHGRRISPSINIFNDIPSHLYNATRSRNGISVTCGRSSPPKHMRRKRLDSPGILLSDLASDSFTDCATRVSETDDTLSTARYRRSHPRERNPSLPVLLSENSSNSDMSDHCTIRLPDADNELSTSRHRRVHSSNKRQHSRAHEFSDDLSHSDTSTHYTSGPPYKDGSLSYGSKHSQLHIFSDASSYSDTNTRCTDTYLDMDDSLSSMSEMCHSFNCMHSQAPTGRDPNITKHKIATMEQLKRLSTAHYEVLSCCRPYRRYAQHKKVSAAISRVKEHLLKSHQTTGHTKVAATEEQHKPQNENRSEHSQSGRNLEALNIEPMLPTVETTHSNSGHMSQPFLNVEIPSKWGTNFTRLITPVVADGFEPVEHESESSYTTRGVAANKTSDKIALTINHTPSDQNLKQSTPNKLFWEQVDQSDSDKDTKYQQNHFEFGTSDSEASTGITSQYLQTKLVSSSSRSNINTSHRKDICQDNEGLFNNGNFSQTRLLSEASSAENTHMENISARTITNDCQTSIKHNGLVLKTGHNSPTELPPIASSEEDTYTQRISTPKRGKVPTVQQSALASNNRHYAYSDPSSETLSEDDTLTDISVTSKYILPTIEENTSSDNITHHSQTDLSSEVLSEDEARPGNTITPVMAKDNSVQQILDILKRFSESPLPLPSDTDCSDINLYSTVPSQNETSSGNTTTVMAKDSKPAVQHSMVPSNIKHHSQPGLSLEVLSEDETRSSNTTTQVIAEDTMPSTLLSSANMNHSQTDTFFKAVNEKDIQIQRTSTTTLPGDSLPLAHHSPLPFNYGHCSKSYSYPSSEESNEYVHIGTLSTKTMSAYSKPTVDDTTLLNDNETYPPTGLLSETPPRPNLQMENVTIAPRTMSMLPTQELETSSINQELQQPTNLFWIDRRIP